MTFTAIQVVTQSGEKYDASAFKNGGNQVYGLQAKSVTVYWDTFHVSLANAITDTLRNVQVSVNVTYLLLPQEGLNLPAQDTYSNQTFLPKIVHGANVTINGLGAQETSAGIYSTNTSTLFPITYILVSVSQNGWTTTYTALNFTHNANSTIWIYGVVAGLVLVCIAFFAYFAIFAKSKKTTASLNQSKLLLIGALLLVLASVVSLYWGSIGFEATYHGFSWMLLALSELGCFVLGVIGSVICLRKTNQAAALATVCVVFVVNFIVVEFSLDAYQLTIPWLIMSISMATAILSGILISNSDKEFSTTLKRENHAATKTQ